NLEDIRRRLELLPVLADVRDLSVSPDGKTLLITAISAGQNNLFTWPLDETASAPPALSQITSTAHPKSGAQFSPDGKQVYYVEEGRIRQVTLANRQVRTLNLRAELDVDFDSEKLEV